MGLDIVTNIMAQQASNDLSTNQSNMQSSLEKLSSGYQINTAADDASGLVISQHLQAQIGAFQQAQSNTQAGINVVQTASGALNEVSTILQRINTLAVESQNSSATDATAQQAAQSEVNQALSSIVDIANTTVYGNNQLLVNGTSSSVNYTFQVGYDGSSSSQVAFSVTALNLANLGLVNGTLTDGTAGVIGTGGSSGIQSVVGNVAAGQYALQATAAVSASQAGNTAKGTGPGYAGGTFYLTGTGETLNGTYNGAAYSINLGTSETAADLQSKLITATGDANLTVSNNAGTLTIASGNANDISVAAGAAGTGAADLGFGAGAASATSDVGSAVAAPSVTTNFYMTAAGETFNIAVDGGQAVTVTMGALETASDLEDKVNSALNAAGQSGSVTVGEANGKLTFTSNAYGANGSIAITAAGASATDLGVGTLNTTAGADAIVGFGTSGALSTVALTQAQDQNGANISFTLGTTNQTAVVSLNGPVVTTAQQTLTQAAFSASTMNELNFSVTAANAISTVQSAIATVSTMQGQFGAYQNELQDISDNETVGIQNLTASNANIMDTNMASQMVNFTQDQVLVQAGVSMLAQANQIPQYVLKLLG
ncbi:MAG TPA: flagellin [Acidimicrobiales bacterium]|nr:flagellin [Acidimicrobiales bacterium]